jgi:large subunit ribosomal protein L17e
MVKYCRQPAEPTKSAKSRVSDLRAHYKNCYETARFCKGMKVKAAIQHMDRVIAHTAIIPYR